MDCLEGMKQLDDNSIDLVITSPPYNTGSRDDCMINSKYINFDDNKTEEEYIFWTVELFKYLEKIVSDKGVVCYNLSYSTKYPQLMYEVIFNIIQSTNFKIYDTIVWKKKSAVPLSSHKKGLTRICEFVFIFSKSSDYNTYKRYVINNKTKQKF